MTDLQEEKGLVLDFLNNIDKAENKYLTEIISKYTSDDFHMKCTHPFNELQGANNVANDLWIPIKNSLLSLYKEEWIFFMLVQI